MPYIKQDDRQCFDQQIIELAGKVGPRSSRETRAGNLNYVITQLILQTYGRQFRYADINEVVGMLECCKQEFYQRVAVPYEKQKAHDNGDVYQQ